MLAVIAALNLIWLFAFDYKVPSFLHLSELINSSSMNTEDNSETEKDIIEEEKGEISEQETGLNPSIAENIEEIGLETGEDISDADVTCKPKEGNAPNIRSGPGTDYNVVGTADYGEIMAVTGDAENGWLPIRTVDGLEGYVFADLVTVMD